MAEAGIHRLELHPVHYAYCKDRQRIEIVEACLKHGVKVSSVHLPISPCDSEDEEERKRAVQQTISAARFGCEVGAEIGVVHLGVSKQSKKSAYEMLDQLQGCPLLLVTENVHERDLRDVMNFVDDIGSNRLAMVVDIGHLRDDDGVNPFFKRDKARDTLAQCGSRVAHVHLHETHIIDHVPPFNGNIQWGEVFKALKDINYRGTFLFEYIHQIAMPEPDPDLLESEPVKYYLWSKARGKVAGQKNRPPTPSKESLLKTIQETPPETVQKALGGTPEQMVIDSTEEGFDETPEQRLREELKRIIRQNGNSGRQIVRYSVGAATDELLGATASFPEEYEKRYDKSSR